MAAVAPPAKFPVGNQRILWGFGESSTSSSSSSVYDVNGGDVKLSMELEGAMLSDTVFRFLDESPDSTTTVSSGGTVDDGYGPYGVRVEEGNEEDKEEEEEEEEEDDNRVFWESHHKLLKDTMSKTSLTERSIRLATKETIKEIQQLSSSTRDDGYCKCNSTPTSEQLVTMGVGIRNCKNCLMSKICQRLRTRGYTNTAMYQTKWKSNHDIPSGEHKFIIVRNNNTISGDDEEVIIIEVRFKAEFEMGIAKGEYSQLMERVPTVFVGRVDRMKMVVKILCSAAKKWCKMNKVHLGPWRKHKFMYAKWFNDSCRKVVASGGGDDEGLVVGVSSSRRNRSINNKGSMLTAALNFLGSNGNDNSLMRPKAVAVL